MDMTGPVLSPPARVAGLIYSALEAPAPLRLSLRDVAVRMCVSSRTLKRRLKREGLSYRRLLEDVRLGHAIQLMNRPELSLEAVASLVGYSNTGNFSRAFRRWAGVSPGRFRQQGQVVSIRDRRHQSSG